MRSKRPTFYEKQVLWKHAREKILEGERARIAEEEEEKLDAIISSNGRPHHYDESERTKPTAIPKKNRHQPTKTDKLSRMQIILEDLNRINSILLDDK